MSRPVQEPTTPAAHFHRCSACNRNIQCPRENCDGTPKKWRGCWGCSDDGPEHLGPESHLDGDECGGPATLRAEVSVANDLNPNKLRLP